MKDYFYIAIICLLCIIFIYIGLDWHSQNSDLKAKVSEAEIKLVNLKKQINKNLKINTIIDGAKDECLDKDIPVDIYNELRK